MGRVKPSKDLSGKNTQTEGKQTLYNFLLQITSEAGNRGMRSGFVGVYSLDSIPIEGIFLFFLSASSSGSHLRLLLLHSKHMSQLSVSFYFAVTVDQASSCSPESHTLRLYQFWECGLPFFRDCAIYYWVFSLVFNILLYIYIIEYLLQS